MHSAGVEDLLRELASQVLGARVRRYGHFDTAEDAVQEALLAAAIQRGPPRYLTFHAPASASTCAKRGRRSVRIVKRGRRSVRIVKRGRRSVRIVKRGWHASPMVRGRMPLVA
jgi:predicted RNA polymerase sigma factor